MDTRYDVTNLLLFVQFIKLKVVGATSSEGFFYFGE